MSLSESELGTLGQRYWPAVNYRIAKIVNWFILNAKLSAQIKWKIARKSNFYSKSYPVQSITVSYSTLNLICDVYHVKCPVLWRWLYGWTNSSLNRPYKAACESDRKPSLVILIHVIPSMWTISYRSYHMDHIIWFIWYGFAIDHMIWSLSYRLHCISDS